MPARLRPMHLPASRRIAPAGGELSRGERRRIAAAAGGVIVYPTDTFYGLGADPFSPGGTARVFALKNRPAGEPLLVLIDSVEQVGRFAAAMSEAHRLLMHRWWPGPLTLLFPVREGLDPALSRDGLVALRVPGSALCRRVLAAAGGALTGTSANRSGEKPAAAVAAIASSVIEGADLVVDAGTLPASDVSTIVSLAGGGVTVVRKGAVNVQNIRNCLAAEGGGVGTGKS